MVVYANIKEEEVHAKTVEVVVYANIRDKEVNAKTVGVVVYASIRGEEVDARTVYCVKLYKTYLFPYIYAFILYETVTIIFLNWITITTIMLPH